jgi:hypothetical protein|tara:strand:+ start:1386 stop:1784 length:399 start_codon:yes stop_codon:yes gene_type:complete
MDILTKIFGGSDLVKEVGKIADDLITSKEEKIILKQQIEAKILEHESNMQTQISERWKADMNSDSWLSKNIRPLTLAFLLFALTIFTLIDFSFLGLEIQEAWIDLWQMLAITAFGAYFGGRSWEKIKRKNEK